MKGSRCQCSKIFSKIHEACRTYQTLSKKDQDTQERCLPREEKKKKICCISAPSIENGSL